jgi:hypothetical protein
VNISTFPKDKLSKRKQSSSIRNYRIFASTPLGRETPPSGPPLSLHKNFPTVSLELLHLGRHFAPRCVRNGHEPVKFNGATAAQEQSPREMDLQGIFYRRFHNPRTCRTNAQKPRSQESQSSSETLEYF